MSLRNLGLGPRLQILVNPPEKLRAFRGFGNGSSRTSMLFFFFRVVALVSVAAGEVGALEELVGPAGERVVVEGLGLEEVPRRRL